MDQIAILDPVLARFRARLDEMYGDRLARVVLFGSRARGDARPDSDYDVAVFLHEKGNHWDEAGLLSGLRVEFMEDTGHYFEAIPFSLAAYDDPVSPLMHEIRREGVWL